MSEKHTITTICDECGAELEHSYIVIYPAAKNVEIIVRVGTTSIQVAEPKDFCTAKCAAKWFHRILGYQPGTWILQGDV